MEHFGHILILLGFAVIVISIFHRINLPPILGYLLVGTMVGPGGFALIPTIDDLKIFAELGIVFLLFTLGLEFSIPRLLAMRKTLIGVGGLQVILSTGLTMLICQYIQFPMAMAFVIGGALAFSSTAVVVKQLTDKNEQQEPHGRLSIGILLFQDIAAILFLILIPTLAAQSDSPITMTILIALAKGLGVCLGMTLLSLWILRPLFHEVAKTRSTELFVLTALLTALSAAWITHHLGLSMALGAFLAGLMLGETEFRHQIELDIRPFKNVLLGLFFITVGALLNFKIIIQHWYYIAGILIGLILLKAFIVTLVAWIVGRARFQIAFRTGVVLSQGGELGFLLLTQAINYRIIDPTQQSIVLSSVVLSIVVAPFLIEYNKAIYLKIFKIKNDPISETHNPQELIEHSAVISNHVIICGYGRVGQVIARFLEQENIPYLALDLDPMRIYKSSLAGEQVFFGDSTRPEILSAAGLARARMLVLSFSNESAALTVLKHVRDLRLDLPVFVRTQDDTNLDVFQEAGATEVVPETLEGSLMLASHLLLSLGLPTHKILQKIRKVHANRYQLLRGFFEGSEAVNILEAGSRISLHTVTIPPNAYAIGKTIDLITQNTSEKRPVKILTRAGVRQVDPKPDTILKSEDILVLHATPEELLRLEESILTGVHLQNAKTNNKQSQVALEEDPK